MSTTRATSFLVCLLVSVGACSCSKASSTTDQGSQAQGASADATATVDNAEALKPYMGNYQGKAADGSSCQMAISLTGSGAASMLDFVPEGGTTVSLATLQNMAGLVQSHIDWAMTVPGTEVASKAEVSIVLDFAGDLGFASVKLVGDAETITCQQLSHR